MAQKNPSMEQKPTHRHRTQTCGCQGERQERKGGPGDLWLIDGNYDIRMDNSKILLCSTGNYIERVTGRKARGLQIEEIACKCQTFLSLLSGRRKQTSNIFSFSIQI